MIPDPFIRERDGADGLREGFYLLRASHRSRRVDVPMRIWFGPPIDETTGEEMDRSPRWQILVGFNLVEELPMRVGGVWIEHLTDIWPRAAAEPIDESEYRYRIERASWASDFDPEDPHGEIAGRIDPMTCRLP